jgi:hypothetical protein
MIVREARVPEFLRNPNPATTRAGRSNPIMRSSLAIEEAKAKAKRVRFACQSPSGVPVCFPHPSPNPNEQRCHHSEVVSVLLHSAKASTNVDIDIQCHGPFALVSSYIGCFQPHTKVVSARSTDPPTPSCSTFAIGTGLSQPALYLCYPSGHEQICVRLPHHNLCSCSLVHVLTRSQHGIKHRKKPTSSSPT